MKKVPLGILCAQPVTRVHAYRRGERERLSVVID